VAAGFCRGQGLPVLAQGDHLAVDLPDLDCLRVYILDIPQLIPPFITLRSRPDPLSFTEADYYDQHCITPLIYRSVVGQNLFVCARIIGIMVWIAMT